MVNEASVATSSKKAVDPPDAAQLALKEVHVKLDAATAIGATAAVDNLIAKHKVSLTSQPFNADTQTLPSVVPKSTVMLGVPVPAVIVAPAGTVQL